MTLTIPVPCRFSAQQVAFLDDQAEQLGTTRSTALRLLVDDARRRAARRQRRMALLGPVESTTGASHEAR